MSKQFQLQVSIDHFRWKHHKLLKGRPFQRWSTPVRRIHKFFEKKREVEDYEHRMFDASVCVCNGETLDKSFDACFVFTKRNLLFNECSTYFRIRRQQYFMQ